MPSEFVRSNEDDEINDKYYNARIDGEQLKQGAFYDNRMPINSDTPVNLHRPKDGSIRIGSIPNQNDLSTINNDIAATSNNDVLIS